MKRYILIVAAALLVMSCSETLREEVAAPVQPDSSVQVSDQGTVPGKMSIKVTDALADELLQCAQSDGQLNADGVAMISIPDVNVTGVRPVFHIGGKFEARQRAAGLHKWFTVSYDESVPAVKASGAAQMTQGIELAEPVMKITPTAVSMNDPYYNMQWHYYNVGDEGGQTNCTAGVDIKLQQAWDAYEVFGDPSVIVGIVDMGVQYDHPDLAGNMWVNEAELGGTPGVDDDGNGYIDDIYGVNFVTGGAIYPQNHGTHVAGTVAAVNNNGIGVCGVAGGRYPDQGVRLIGLQLIDDRYDYSASMATAFQYAADNGAVILQNSWSYAQGMNYLPDVDREAIEYFKTYAGLDENGVQVGPMRGGLAIFAAGNDAATLCYPAAYDGVLSVAAIGPTGRYAYYTNYGAWVDICAPGGDTSVAGDYYGVYSTFPTNQYGSDQGTSMACPHVSGVAALVLSALVKEGRQQGFTPDNLFKLLVNTADESIYEYNANRYGLLGSGMVDALAAVGAAVGTPAPGSVRDFSMSALGNTITFTADVPQDAQGNDATYLYVYYSTSQFSTSDLSSVSRAEFKVSDLSDAAGGGKTFTLEGLDFSTRYWCAVAAANILGEASTPVGPRQISTLENRPPVIVAQTEGEWVLRSAVTSNRVYTVSDPDGQDITVTWNNGGLAGVTFASITESEVMLTINSVQLDAGSYTVSLTVTDIAGSSTSLEIPFTVLENNAPRFIPADEIALMGVGSTAVFNPYDLFYDADGDDLDIQWTTTDDNIVSATRESNGLMTLTALAGGRMRFAFTVTDPKGAQATGGLTVSVVESAGNLEVYPSPARSHVYVRTAESGIWKVTVVSAAGRTIYSTSAAVSLSTPLEIDLAGVTLGQYTVKVEGEAGQSYTGSFVKI